MSSCSENETDLLEGAGDSALGTKNIRETDYDVSYADVYQIVKNSENKAISRSQNYDVTSIDDEFGKPMIYCVNYKLNPYIIR